MIDDVGLLAVGNFEALEGEVIGGAQVATADLVDRVERLGQDLVLVRRDERGKVAIARLHRVPYRSRGRRGRAPAVHARSTVAIA